MILHWRKKSYVIYTDKKIKYIRIKSYMILYWCTHSRNHIWFCTWIIYNFVHGRPFSYSLKLLVFSFEPTLYIGSNLNENAYNLREYENGRPCTKSYMIYVQNHIWLRECACQYKIIYDFTRIYLIFFISIKSYMIFFVSVKSYMILYMNDHSCILLNS